MKNSYTYHALKDFWLGGYQAVVRNNGRVIHRSPGSFSSRTAALRAARAYLRACYHPG